MSEVFNLIEDFLRQYDISTERGKIIIEKLMENDSLTEAERVRYEREDAKYEGMKQVINTISRIIHTIRVVREMDCE